MNIETRIKDYIAKNIPRIYDQNIVGNRMTIPFDSISPEDLKCILDAVFVVVEKEYQIL